MKWSTMISYMTFVMFSTYQSRKSIEFWVILDFLLIMKEYLSNSLVKIVDDHNTHSNFAYVTI